MTEGPDVYADSPGAARVHTTVDTPVGPLTVVCDAGAVTGIYFCDHRPAPTTDRLGRAAESTDAFAEVTEQLHAYFRGDLRSFDVPIRSAGTPFQETVWSALREIPYGQTRTYGDIAAAIGRPSAVRAVATANARNPLSILVPCHRVVGANGTLTGYAGGLDAKRVLLELEGAQRNQLF